MWLYGWELIAVCHHPERFVDNKHFNSGDLMFLISLVTSRDHMLQELYVVMWLFGWHPLTEVHHLALFGNHGTSASEVKKFVVVEGQDSICSCLIPSSLFTSKAHSMLRLHTRNFTIEKKSKKKAVTNVSNEISPILFTRFLDKELWNI